MARFIFYNYYHLGNTRLTYSATATLGEETATIIYTAETLYDYDPYGKVLRSFVRLGSTEKYLTTGHERDTETDLDYRGARFYDSEVVRFLSLDPLAAKYAAWSAYNYVLGNPVMLVDPTGAKVEETAVTEAEYSSYREDRSIRESNQDQDPPGGKKKKSPPPAPTNGSNGALIMYAVKQFAYNHGVAPTYSLGLDFDATTVFGGGYSFDINWLFVGKDASLFPYLTYTSRINAAAGIFMGTTAHFSNGGVTDYTLNSLPFRSANTFTKEDFFNTNFPTTANTGAFGVGVDIGQGLDIGVSLSHSYLSNSYQDGRYISKSISAGIATNNAVGMPFIPITASANAYTSGIISHLSPFVLYNNLKSWWYGK